MKFVYVAGGAVGLLMFAAGCPQTPPAAETFSAADEAAITGTELAWAGGWESRNAARVTSCYAVDALVTGPDSDSTKGTRAILTRIEEMLADRNLSLRLIPLGGGRAVGVRFGEFFLTRTNPKTNAPFTRKGDYFNAYTRLADGSWIIARTFLFVHHQGGLPDSPFDSFPRLNVEGNPRRGLAVADRPAGRSAI